jgi:hypothetical protein
MSVILPWSHSLAWPPAPPSFHHVSPPLVRPHKRRHEADDDDVMDRSPTPERLKRAIPKRVKLSQAEAQKEAKSEKESDVDVGVLLGLFFCPVVPS